MKLKLITLLSFFLILTAATFAQKPDPPKTAVKPPDEKAPQAAKLPSASEIVAKYVKALGGREANEKIKSRVLKGTVELSPMNIKGTAELYSSAPDKSLVVLNIAGVGEIREGFDGKTAWSINPIQGNRDKTGQELLQVKLASSFYREINLDKLYSKMEVKGTQKVGDMDAYVVIATAEGVPNETLYFDTVSGLLLRSDTTSISPEGNINTTSYYEDYREVDGIKIPFKVRSVLPQFAIISTFTEVKNNVIIEDAKFGKPKQ